MMVTVVEGRAILGMDLQQSPKSWNMYVDIPAFLGFGVGARSL